MSDPVDDPSHRPLVFCFARRDLARRDCDARGRARRPLGSTAAPTPAPLACAQPSVPAATLEGVEPDTPALAEHYGIGGSVEIIVSLDAGSHVVDASIYRSSNPISTNRRWPPRVPAGTEPRCTTACHGPAPTSSRCCTIRQSVRYSQRTRCATFLVSGRVATVLPVTRDPIGSRLAWTVSRRTMVRPLVRSPVTNTGLGRSWTPASRSASPSLGRPGLGLDISRPHGGRPRARRIRTPGRIGIQAHALLRDGHGRRDEDRTVRQMVAVAGLALQRRVFEAAPGGRRARGVSAR